MGYHEHLNIIYMRDNGPRHSIRARRSVCYMLILFFVSLPFICIGLCIQSWNLWQENRKLTANIERFETDAQMASARADKLEKLEALLLEENVENRDRILRKLAYNEISVNTSVGAETPMGDGPGHEEFPVVDTGRVKVSNVQARIMSGNRLRIALDVRNPDNERLLSGDIRVTLVTAKGEQRELVFTPSDVASFRINRFKRSVMVAKVPNRFVLNNSEVVIEVKEENGKTIFRNIYAVQG